ncbi:MAG: AAA family ATPase [Treponema sp.]|nr:AAA family ATPase [Candidatus Treponema merdequi]
MAIPVLVMGESGSGKTFSLKNFSDCCVFSVEKNRLPFKANGCKIIPHATYESIGAEMSKGEYKAYVIDDSQYLLVNEMFDRAKETGYGKFTDIALRFRNMIHFINQKMDDDKIVYLLHHTEIDSNSGRAKAKTVGKMLDNQLTVEGCFDIVLMTKNDNGTHSFITQSDGYNTCKSPEGMFDFEIPNDLKAVDTKIREYYGLINQPKIKKE